MRNHLMASDCSGVTGLMQNYLTFGKKELEIKATLLLQIKSVLIFLANRLVNNRCVKFEA